jgi:hypothetical protein
MASVRPLRDLLADLVGEGGVRSGGPEAYLAEHGHPDLPPELMAEAVVSFADTAPPEVAEHLAPFVTAHTAGAEHTADWFDLLTSSPTGLADDPDTLDGSPDIGDDLDPDPGAELDFGAGAVDTLDTPASLDESADDAMEAPTAPDSPADHFPLDTDTSESVTDDIVTDHVESDEEQDEEPLD